MKLVTMYTVNGRVRVREDHLADKTRDILPMFNQFGERCESSRGLRCYGVHRANLAKTKAEAINNREEIYKEMFPELYKQEVQ